MLKFYLKALVFFACTLVTSIGYGQGASNKGTDFWLGYGKHTSTGQMVVYITSDVATTATVSIDNLGFSQPVSVPANGIVSVDIPKAAHLVADGLSQNGIHITSLKPIIVYAHIYASSVSGATLVLPVNALGKDYMSINYKQISNSSGAVSWFFVVAVEDNTQVEITPSQDTEGGLVANVPHLITLQKGEIYNVLGKYTNVDANSNNNNNVYSFGNDLTGSRIKSISSNGSCKKIAVFSGSSKIAINCINYTLPTTGTNIATPGAADNLIQQAYPTETWGRNFITVPQKERNFVIYRIVKSDPSTVVKINGTEVNFTLFHDFESQEIEQVSADKPIQVVQYAVTQGKTIGCFNAGGDVGDPEMIYLNPLEQTLTNITMYSTGRFNILKHFINVVIKSEGVASFTLDGTSVSSSFIVVPNNPEYSYAQLSVTEGTHNLQSKIGFNAIAYGFGSAESYGYAAGANLTAFGITPVNVKTPNTEMQTGCVGALYDLTLKLPYQASQIKFDSGDGNGLQPITLNPLPNIVDNDGKITYVYSLIPQITYSDAKIYSYKVEATKPSADACGSADEFLFDFIINPQPVADFNLVPEVCINSSISFKPNKLPNQTITEYLWDFNGETTANTENADHTYTTEGIKTNKLLVKSEDGCWSVAKELQTEVMTLPLAKFSQQNITCVGGSIQFTDQSTIDKKAITSWMWDFGDPTSASNSSTDQNPMHTFNQIGTYDVKLTVSTALGCSNVVTQKVTIHPLPEVDFDTPDICLDDASAQFINKSTISDGTAMSYVWDFGDYNSTPVQNTSIAPNPSHKYSRADIYQVTLIATSASGCVTTLTKPFTVNGSTPKAEFTIQNEGNLCSDQEVVFEDLASVDFGEITKIEWIYDSSKPTEVEVDNNPATRAERAESPRLYSHLYQEASLTVIKDITVIMKAFSGTTCVSSISKTIRLNPVPNVVFNSLNNVCAEVSPFLLTQAFENKGLKGEGNYIGPGVDENGVFSPAKAGVGTHTISYNFTTDDGCSNIKTQDINVYPTPSADAGIDKTILTGGNIVLDANASGNNITYKWTPATGLDRDDVLSPTASPLNDVTYTLTVSSDQGCIIKDDVFVKVLQFPEIPNTFTPNGDGVNDTWNIKYLESYPTSTIKIFNRYGKDVFTSGTYQPWDGKLNNEYLPAGMYYYIITANGGELKYSGSLMLVR